MITSKGYTLTASYAEVLPEHSQRIATEFINTGATTAHLVVGGTLANAADVNAIPIIAGTSYTPPTPLAGAIYMKGDKVVVLADAQGG